MTMWRKDVNGLRNPGIVGTRVNKPNSRSIAIRKKLEEIKIGQKSAFF